MLAHVAACATLFLFSTVCAGIDGSSALPRPQPAASIAQQPAPDVLRRELDTPVAGPADNSAAISIERPRSPEPEPFGLGAEPVAVGAIVAKWIGVEAEIRAEDEVLDRCRERAWCPTVARRFLTIVDEGRARNGRVRIGIINRAINFAIIPTSDVAQWSVADRWSAPFETFTTRRGDCEDYAIAKYVALRAAGVAEADVKLVVVRNTAAGEDHAVVAVRFDAAWIILDNRWLPLVRDWEMPRARPLFVLDDNGVRRFLAPGSIAKLPEIAASAF
jgi:predicted transglutaminase-like cysteine proteinase